MISDKNSSASRFPVHAKALFWGVLVGAISCAGLMLLFAALLSFAKTPNPHVIHGLSVAAAAVCALVAGFITGRISCRGGLIYGATAGLLMFSLLTLVGFIVSRDKFTYLSSIKLAFMVISGAVGGLFAVNKR